MFSLEGLQLIGLAVKVVRDLVGLLANFLRKNLLLLYLLKEARLLEFKPLKFLAQLLVKISLVAKVFLQVAIEHTLQVPTLLELTLQLFCQPRLVHQLCVNLSLLLCASVEFHKYHVESLHQCELVILQS